MSLPKKKNNINVYKNNAELRQRVKQIVAEYNFKTLLFPQTFDQEELSQGFVNDCIDGDLSVTTVEGEQIPVYFLTNETWGEFARTWESSDRDENIVPPYLTVKIMESTVGTFNGGKKNIPNNRLFTYIKLPVLKNGELGFDLYQASQPTPIDLLFEYRLITSYQKDVDQMQKVLYKTFASLQHYLQIKGHYFSCILEGQTKDGTMDNYDGNRYYSPAATIRLRAYLQSEEDFQLIPARHRVAVAGSIAEKEIFNFVIKQQLTNENI